MSFFSSNEKVAIGIGARRVRLFVGRGNGRVRPLHSAAAPVDADAVRSGVRAPAFTDRDAVLSPLRELVTEAKQKGLLKRSPETVAVLVADGAFKMARSPLEGAAPGRTDGDRMARWMLRDLLPVGEDEIRADWHADSVGGATVLLSVGSTHALLNEYEDLVAELGWTAGRVVPWSFAAAAAVGGGAGSDEAADDGAARRDLVLCDADGALGALFQNGALPGLHRAWRVAVPGGQIGTELPALRRYVNDRLETSIGRVWLCGDPEWTAAAAEACELNQVDPGVIALDDALRAAVEG